MLALVVIIRLAPKRITVIDTLTYYVTLLVTKKRSFITLTIGVNIAKLLSVMIRSNKLECFP
jgi:hypothetical protein